MTPTPRPGILEVAPYVGGDAAIPGRNRVIRLASNENPLGPSPRAMAAYATVEKEIHRYPEGGALALREAIAGAEDLDPARIVCGAGSDELIALLVRGYAGPGDEVLHSEHGFLMYSISARTAGAEPIAAPERDLTADVDALLERVSDRTRMVFLANPNNPDGPVVPEGSERRDKLAQGGVVEGIELVRPADLDLGEGAVGGDGDVFVAHGTWQLTVSP